MTSEHGGHRHGVNYGLPDYAKTHIKVPKHLVDECRVICHELFKEWLTREYGVDSLEVLEQLAPGDYFEAVQRLSTKRERR